MFVNKKKITIIGHINGIISRNILGTHKYIIINSIIFLIKLNRIRYGQKKYQIKDKL